MWIQRPSNPKSANNIINKIAWNLTTPVLSAQSDLATQWPTALDTPHQITYWPAQNWPTDPVQLLADWSIVINEAWNYYFRFRGELWRAWNPWIAVIMFRTLVDWVQVWQTTTEKMDTNNDVISFDIFAPATLASSVVTAEMVRDSSWSNDWFLEQTIPVLWDWFPSATASVQVYKVDQEF